VYTVCKRKHWYHIKSYSFKTKNRVIMNMEWLAIYKNTPIYRLPFHFRILTLNIAHGKYYYYYYYYYY
jgi:hypothetical protein